MKAFDIAISFAGEDRVVAQSLAYFLKREGLLVFYDDEEQANLLGENLTEYLVDVYKNQASYCAVLVSKDYVRKRWTRHEWRAAQSRAFEEFDQAYILPVRLDEADLPGLLPTVGYLSLKTKTIEEVGRLITEKIRSTARLNRTLRAAEKASHGGDFVSAVSLLSDDATYPQLRDDLKGLRLLADASMHLGRYDEGVRVLKEVTERFSDDAESHFLLGVCLYRLSRYSEAVISLQRAVELAPFHLTALQDLRHARARVWGEKFRQGVAWLRRTVLRKP